MKLEKIDKINIILFIILILLSLVYFFFNKQNTKIQENFRNESLYYIKSKGKLENINKNIIHNTIKTTKHDYLEDESLYNRFSIWANKGGLMGSTGPIGPQGLMGIRGETGQQGLQGDIGPTGPMGPTGIQGSTGTVGPTGPIGPTGIQGSTGTVGPTGPTGIQGPVAPVGPAGLAATAGTFTTTAAPVTTPAPTTTAAPVTTPAPTPTAAPLTTPAQTPTIVLENPNKYDVYKNKFLKKGWGGSGWSGNETISNSNFTDCEKNCSNNPGCYGFELNNNNNNNKTCYSYIRRYTTPNESLGKNKSTIEPPYSVSIGDLEKCSVDNPFTASNLSNNCIGNDNNTSVYWKKTKTSILENLNRDLYEKIIINYWAWDWAAGDFNPVIIFRGNFVTVGTNTLNTGNKFAAYRFIIDELNRINGTTIQKLA